MNKSNEASLLPWKPWTRQPSDDFSALAESLPALVFTVDADGWVMQANRRFQDYTGLDRSAAAGSTWLSRVHVHDRSRALAAWSAAMAEGCGVELRLRLCRSDGSGEWFDCRGMPVHVDGRIDRWAFSAMGAPDTELAAPLPDHGNAWYAQAFEHAGVGLARVDGESRILAANDCLCRMLGCSQAQLLGSDAGRLKAHDDRANQAGSTAPHGATEPAEAGQRWLRADGSRLDVTVTTAPVPGEAGHFLWVIEDASRHKVRERALAEHDAMLESFVGTAPVALALFDRDMRYLAYSRQYLVELGLPGGVSLRGRSHYDVLPEVPRRWREIHARVLQGEEHCSEDEPFHRPDGSTDWVRWAMRPWGRRSGTIDGAVLLFEVVTARVLTERARQGSLQRLRDSEARHRRRAALLTRCLEAAPFAVWARDAQGRWLLANPVASALLTPAQPSSHGRVVNGVHCALQIEREEEERVLQEGVTVRAAVELFDPAHGTPRRLLVSLTPMPSGADGIHAVLGFAHDIKEPDPMSHDGKLPTQTQGSHDINGGRGNGRPQSL